MSHILPGISAATTRAMVAAHQRTLAEEERMATYTSEDLEGVSQGTEWGTLPGNRNRPEVVDDLVAGSGVSEKLVEREELHQFTHRQRHENGVNQGEVIGGDYVGPIAGDILPTPEFTVEQQTG